MGNLRLESGRLFANRFEIERAAGAGGMGTVYRATDRYSGDTVALKLLHSGAGGSDEAERFLREALLLSELRHPGIVAHVAHGQTPDGQRFLAMEWLQGQDLAERLTRGPLPIRDCLRVLEQVADALSVAHQRGIVHRDLKPSNLFLIEGDLAQVKLLDFGIARRIAASRAMTRTGMVIGTPEYMAPEQARGSRDLTPAADVFSLGCVLYECLTGQPPFVADHIAEVLVRILFEEPIPIEERRPGISQSLAALMGRMLAKDPAQRIENAAALRAELAQLGDLPEPALAATMAGPMPKVESFAAQEQSLFSIVLAAPQEEDIGLGATLPGSDVQLSTTDRQALLQALAALGGSPDFLANGTLVVTVPPVGSAQDQVTLAARAALLIKDRWPDAVVSMATGRGAVRGRTAVGEVVEQAARSLQSGSHASFGKPTTGVLIDQLSAKLLAGRFAQVQQPGGALLLHEEVDVDASRLLLGKPTPCVGRESELGILEAQLFGCIEESEARVVLCTAQPGVGKSRLRHEFLRRVEKRSPAPTLLLGRGDMMSAGAAYGILRSAIHKLCGISGSDPVEIQRQRLRTRIAQHLSAAEQERVVLFVGELCQVPFSEAEHPMLQAARQNPKRMREMLRRAVLDFFSAECAAAPVVLVMDDLQWGDELTVSVLDEVLSGLAGAPLLVLAFARPEVHQTFPKLWPTHGVQEIPLKRLSRKACERLIVQVLGEGVDAEAIARAVAQSEGNALFLEELIRSIAEGTSETPSDTVLAMLQARLSRLDGPLRRAVQAASVFGQTFWHGGVAALLGIAASAPELQSWLSALVEAEIIRPHAQSRIREQSEYGFRHALVRDAAYQLLTASDLATGNRLAAAFLESVGDADFAVIAEHYQHGNDMPRAVSAYVQAAEAAIDKLAPALTIRLVEAGVSCGAAGEALGTLRSCEAFARFHLGQMASLGQPCIAALALLKPGCRARGRTLYFGILAALMGSPEAGAQLPAMTAELILTDPDPGAEHAYAEGLAFVPGMMCTSVPAEQWQPVMARLESLVGRLCLRDSSMRRYLLASRAHTGFHCAPRPWTVLQDAEEVFRLYLEAGDAFHALISVGTDLVWTLRGLGDEEKAMSFLESNRIIAERIAGTVAEGMHRVNIASILAARPDPAAHQLAIQQTLPLLSVPFIGAFAQDARARIYLQQGRIAEAETAARQALDGIVHLPNLAPQVRAPLIHALLLQGHLADARKVAEEGLAFLQQFGCAGYAEVELRLAISEAFDAAGEPQRARSELAETIRQIQLRAEDIADAFWRNSYLTRNPYCARAQQLARQWGLLF